MKWSIHIQRLARKSTTYKGLQAHTQIITIINNKKMLEEKEYSINIP